MGFKGSLDRTFVVVFEWALGVEGLRVLFQTRMLNFSQASEAANRNASGLALLASAVL
jgi:hypothetical protein